MIANDGWKGKRESKSFLEGSFNNMTMFTVLEDSYNEIKEMKSKIK